jgi:hypothetical protein
MNTNEFKVRARTLKHLAIVGERIIGRFKDYIDENELEDLSIQTEDSPYRLRVSFHGLCLLFLVELRLRPGGGQGVIAVYHLSYDAKHKELPLNVRYQFDELGNVRKEAAEPIRTVPDDECAAPFFADVFTQLATQDDIILRP